MAAQKTEEWFNSLKFNSLLGTGSFGFVFQANKTTSASRFALKICFLENLSNSPAEQEKERARMLREFHIMKALKHENLVNVSACYEKDFTPAEISSITTKMSSFGDDDGAEERLAVFLIQAKKLKQIATLCLEMELCGNTLRRWIADMSQHEKKTAQLQTDQWQILKDLMKGLGFLHKNKLMHRDLRPENIMFSDSKDTDKFCFPLKIGDFGLCRNIHAEESMTGSLTANIGMLEYRAPEVERGHYTEKADLFSFGLIMWEVLQLLKPSVRRSYFQELVYDGDLSLIMDGLFITNARDIITQCTKPKPEERPKSIFKLRLEAKMK